LHASLTVHARQDDEELVATVTADRRRWARFGDLGDFAQEPVARRVALGVV
jgi:hypothetical protein